MYIRYQLLAKVKPTSIGKLLDSISRNDVSAKLCSDEFKVAYGRDRENTLQTPSHHMYAVR
jgi:hypothetical protein